VRDVNELKGTVHELGPKKKNCVVQLVGNKCVVKAAIVGRTFDFLWDTGVQVSLCIDQWLKTEFPNASIRNISQLFDQKLAITSATGETLGVSGWVELGISISGTEHSIKVPFVVTNVHMDKPILGYNVIAHLSESGINVKNFQSVFQGLEPKKVEALSSLMKQNQEEECVRVKRITNNESWELSNCALFCASWCSNWGEVALFYPVDNLGDTSIDMPESLVCLSKGAVCSFHIPVKNNTARTVTLHPGQLLGQLKSVKSVVTLRPPEAYQQSEEGIKETGMYGRVSMVQEGDADQSIPSAIPEAPDDGWDPVVVLDENSLTPDQVQQVRTMLREECKAFTQNDDDIGCIPDLQLDIELLDKTPVKRTYSSVPPPLYTEVKYYILDLLNKGWIQKSTSAYSSPMLCVRKRDSSLRLCIDYRALNAKSNHSRRPIPRLQNTLDNLK
jgi:hypothetical protein